MFVFFFFKACLQLCPASSYPREEEGFSWSSQLGMQRAREGSEKRSKTCLTTVALWEFNWQVSVLKEESQHLLSTAMLFATAALQSVWRGRWSVRSAPLSPNAYSPLLPGSSAKWAGSQRAEFPPRCSFL